MRYGRASLARGFSWQFGLSCFRSVSSSPSLLSSAGLLSPASSPTSLAPALPAAGQPTLLRHPLAQTTFRGTGILTCYPSTTPFGLALGPTNPTRIDLPSETLDLRGLRFSHSSRYSCQHSHFHPLHDSLPVSLLCKWNARLLPIAYLSTKYSSTLLTRSFGGGLEPRYIFGAESLDQ